MNTRRTGTATLTALLLALVTATNALAATAVNVYEPMQAGYLAGWSSKILSAEGTFTLPKIGTSCPNKGAVEFGVAIGDPTAAGGSTPYIKFTAYRIIYSDPYRLYAGSYSPTNPAWLDISKVKTFGMVPGDMVRLRIDYLPTLRKANVYAWNLTRGTSAMTDLYFPDNSFWTGDRAFVGTTAYMYGSTASFGTVPVRNAKVFLANGGTYGFGDANTTSAKRVFMQGKTGRTIVTTSAFTSTTYFTLTQLVCD